MTGRAHPTKQQMAAMRFLARSFPIVWAPHELDVFNKEFPEPITARKLVPALRSLYAMGYAKPYPKLGKWACVMTIAGMKAFEEASGQSGLVAQAKAAWLLDERANGHSTLAAEQGWLRTPGMIV